MDTAAKRLRLVSGGEFGFDKLIIATGARVNTLKIPGATLGNVRYLRSLDDSKAIRETAANVKRAVVIGSAAVPVVVG